jgi:coenzyme F420-reducing hydrogenase beta subunit
MCMEVKEVAEAGDALQKQLEKLASNMEAVKSLNKKARYYAVLKQVKDAVEKEMDNYKTELLDEEVKAYFPDDDLKVVFQEGAQMSMINATKLYNQLLDEGREEEFLQVVTVTEKALSNLKDGEVLIAKNKEILETRKSPSLRVAPLSKDDRKLLTEGAIQAAN